MHTHDMFYGYIRKFIPELSQILILNEFSAPTLGPLPFSAVPNDPVNRSVNLLECMMINLG